MTRNKILTCIAALGIAFLAARVSAEEALDLKTPKDKTSYGIGADMGRNFRKQGIEIDLDLLVKGLKDGLSGEKLLIPEKELRKIMADLQAELRRKQVQTMRLAAENNQKEGDALLAENKAKDGVVSLPSGLQYKILREAKGKTPTEADTVQVNYRGALLDGTEFDGTEPGKPATLKVNAVIRGWSEALQLMSAGSKWQLFVPPHLAYGVRGSGLIGPNATLIFEVELLAIQ